MANGKLDFSSTQSKSARLSGGQSSPCCLPNYLRIRFRTSPASQSFSHFCVREALLPPLLAAHTDKEQFLSFLKYCNFVEFQIDDNKEVSHVAN